MTVPHWWEHGREASRYLERWEVGAARAAAERARVAAASWGDVTGVAMSDLLLARVALLTSAEPELANLDGVLRADDAAPGAGSREVADTRALLAAEILAGRCERRALRPDLAPLRADSSGEEIATAAVLGLHRLDDGAYPPQRIAGASAIEGRSDAGAWPLLVQALDAEASSHSGMAVLDAALARGAGDRNRALLWTALGLKAALCAQRGVQGEERAARLERWRLIEEWAVTVPAADARRALERPDRIRARRFATPGAPAEPARPTAPARLVDIALALAQERDSSRLIEMALDAAIGVSGAERGILLLADNRREPRVAAARLLDRDARADEVVRFSSTIARRALENGEVVVANEPHRDSRWKDCASVTAEITSLICVPIHARAEREGAIYLDRRARMFEPDAVGAVRAIGSMLASALLNARTIGDLQVRTRDLERTRDELDAALARRTLERDDASRRLAEACDLVGGSGPAMVGRSPSMLRLRRLIDAVARSDAPVLVTGETGSGKDLVARAIHAASARHDGAFVPINCGALSETLLAAELFGVERGAYTGASTSRAGLFRAADGGTLFLDEVGDMPPAMQMALLRVLESGEIRPIGSSRSSRVDVRILAASHRDLLDLVRRGIFRDDLRYRLEVVCVEVPPLRDRIDDLPELCEHLLNDVRLRYRLPARRLSPGALEALARRRWTGNIRELRHVLASAALTCEGSLISPTDLPEERHALPPGSVTEASLTGGDGHELRAESIRRALRATNGRRAEAAKLLGISRSTLYRYLQGNSALPAPADIASRPAQD